MPFGTITATESTFGSISGSIVGAVPGTLSGSVGVPGPQGPQGIQGPAGPEGPPGVGGTWGSITGTLSSQTDLQTALDGKYSTSNPSGFITASALSPYLLSATAASTYQTLAGMSSYLTTAAAASSYYPLTGNPSGFLTSAPVTSVAGRTGAITLSNTDISGLGTMATASASNYSTTAVADTLYAPIAAGLPTGGTVGQILTKQSGTNFDASFQTLIPGDRYLTSSTTSLTINNANKTLTIGTGLSYTTQQDIVISYDAANHMHARVLTYNSGTGVMDVDVLSHSGAGTYAAWTVNVGGAPALQSIVWGDITGTLGNQTDLATALNAKLELSGGVLTVNSTIDASTATASSTFAGDAFGVQLSANPSENSSLQYGGLQVQNAVGTMSVTPAGLTFPNSSTQTVAYPGSSGFLLKADNLTGLADTAVSRTNLGLGTMAVATAADYSTTTVANGLYYPLTGNPSSFLVAADINGKANLASPDFTGNVTINSSTGAALFITQTGTGNILTLYDQASDTTFVAIDANGKVSTIASETTNGAGFNIAHGVAPTTPVNGDIWTTTSGLFARINAGTQQFAPLGSNNTFSNASSTYGSSTAAGTLNFGTGATISGATKAINIGTNGVSGSTTNITLGSATSGATNAITVNGPMTVGNNFTANGLNINIGPLTATAFYNFGTGALVSGATRTIGIGTNALAGSTNNITIGSTTGTSTTTLQGATNGVTQTAGNSTTLLATTAFVTTADNLKANLASPTFTGTPSLPTGTIAVTQTAGNNTTAVATTAFVTAAVPAIATFAESQQLTSTTAVMSPFDTITAMMTEGYRPALGMTGGSSGAGAGVNPIMPQYIGLGGPNSGVAGSCHAVTNTAGGYITGVDPVSIKFNKPIWLSGSFRINTAGDSNNDFKAYIGTSMLNGNDPTGPSIGWYRQGGASMPISLMVHNGTTLTKVASASSYGSGSTAVIRYMVYSDGAGNVTLYINGTSVATTALGPTGSTTAAVAQFTASTSSTASSTARVYFDLYHPKIFVAPQ